MVLPHPVWTGHLKVGVRWAHGGWSEVQDTWPWIDLEALLFLIDFPEPCPHLVNNPFLKLSLVIPFEVAFCSCRDPIEAIIHGVVRQPHLYLFIPLTWTLRCPELSQPLNVAILNSFMQLYTNLCTSLRIYIGFLPRSRS